ncbi:MAG TPA: HAD family hydrolase [Phycisphaerae bacterium]|nr:HAD family hydrolase [Phycisphaerae bacterium]HRY68660.1 HAD family hydrolase [Phycisphaerae bacterium]HSA25486.1 HAD family hydrolase [Phycisphaerae bacterium]
MPNEATRTSSGSTPRAAAVLFDLDGTLTRPYFDFAAIRAEIGLAPESRLPILESIELMEPLQRKQAEEILLRREREAALASELWDDAHAVLAALRTAGLILGLMTRNSRVSAETVIAKHGLKLDRVHTREDGPVKPSPEPVLALCAQLGVAPVAVWVVGDYLFDIQSGQAAGATTALMIGDAAVPDYADQANHVIRRLGELPALLGLGARLPRTSAPGLP